MVWKSPPQFFFSRRFKFIEHKTESWGGHSPVRDRSPTPFRLTNLETNIDFNTYNNRVSDIILNAGKLEDLLFNELSCDLVNKTPGSPIYRGRCPVHGGDGENFQLRTDGKAVPINWKCFSHSCERRYKSSLLGLVWGILSFQKTEKVPIHQAVNYIDKFVAGLPEAGSSSPRRTSPRPRSAPPTPTWTREQVRRQLDIPSDYFVGRGFSPAVLDQMDVGHSRKLKRSVVPLYGHVGPMYDDAGQTCIGFLSRYEGPACPHCGRCHEESGPCGRHDDRWRLSKGFPKGSYLYNFRAAWKSSSPFVVLVEGPGDAWRCAEAGVPAVASLGAELTAQQAEKFLLLDRRHVLIAYDNDEAGREGARRALQRLSGIVRQADQLLVPEQYHDVAEMRASVLAEWVRQAARSASLPR